MNQTMLKNRYSKLTSSMLRMFSGMVMLLMLFVLLNINTAQAQSMHGNASINANYTEVFEGPNTGKPIAIISRFTPVQTLSQTGEYTKVRDVWGKDGWVRNSDLSKTRYVLAKGPVTSVYRSAGTDSGLAYEVTSNVALKVISANNGWLQVEHYDKSKGYVTEDSVKGY